MNSLARTIAKKCINVGTPSVLMGAMWLYLWVVHWMDAYFYDNRWGHDYPEASASLIVELAYFNQRLISDVIALVAATLIVPVALELLPHWVTAIAGGVMIILTLCTVSGNRSIAILAGARLIHKEQQYQANHEEQDHRQDSHPLPQLLGQSGAPFDGREP